MLATILLFAVARERAGVASLTVELPENPTVSDLKAAIARISPALAPILPMIRIAVNSEYAQDDHQVIPEGAELAAIPPVSGGGLPIEDPS